VKRGAFWFSVNQRLGPRFQLILLDATNWPLRYGSFFAQSHAKHGTNDQVMCVQKAMSVICGSSLSLITPDAVGGVFGKLQEIDPTTLERNFQINVMALLHLVRRLAPSMIEAGHGVIIASGNTSALRGKANFAGFAPTKAAQRVLAESIARELGPKGIHVAYIIIDAVIDLEWTRKMHPNAPDDFFIQPRDIAAEVWHVAHQPRSAWSFNVELRPFGEHW
jgi:NAD(P)-dependent dehydrogenase (short-subunit alcohol dehydrogenase family)